MSLSLIEKVAWRVKRRYRQLVCSVVPVTQFVIVTSGRTGSTFLTDLLHGSPEITTCGEYFTDNRLKKQNLAGLDLLSEFKEVMKRDKYEKARGVKFLYYQLESSYAERFSLPELIPVQDYVLNNTDFRIIHLTRKNKLRTAVSIRVAQHSGVYHATDRVAMKKSMTTKIEIDPSDLVDQLQKMESDETNCRHKFSAHRIHEVVYEDLLENREEEISKIAKFLNVNYQSAQSRLLKLGQKNLSDSIVNYPEVVQALEGTQWGMFLDEVG